MKRKYLALSMVLTLVTGLSCDRATGLPTTGGINIVLLSETQTALVIAPRPDGAADVAWSTLSGNPLNVLLDGVRVTVTGPTNKSETVTTAAGGFFNVTVSGLEPGSYSVVVEGLVGGKVAHYGQQQGVSVAAGANSTSQVTFPKFVPGVPLTGSDTSDVLRFTVSFTAVQNATSYVVDWSTSPAMANPQTKTIAGTTTDIAVSAEGTYYFTVRAVNAAVGTSGLPSTPRPVFVFQGVATVTVTPANPAINAGATQQLTAEAKDADNAVVSNVAWYWASSNHSAATVDQTGLVTGVGGGSATITAVGKGTPGSASLTVTALPATKLVFLVQPSAALTGAAISPAVQVEVQNASSGRVTTSSAPVTIAIETNPGSGTLSGTLTVNAINGVASFSGLSLNKVGTGYRLGASSGSLTQALSNTFDVTASQTPTKLAFSVAPTNAVAGEALSQAIQVEIQDANSNRVVGNRDAVTMTFANNAGGGTLSGTKTVNAVDGIASFTGLSVNKAASGYTLSATSGSLTAATSASFSISPASAARLRFVGQPTNIAANTPISPAVTVTITDQFDNAITNLTDQVSISVGGSPWKSPLSIGGAVGGVTDAPAVVGTGLATFGNLRLDKPGTGFRLSASSGSLIAGTSAAFNVTLNLTAVDVGSDHACAIGASGIGTYCWGNNESGQLGILTGFSGSDSIATLVRGGLTFVQISAGGQHTCGRMANGSVFCWGDNEFGQLGNNTLSPSDVPVLVTGGHVFATISAGNGHTCGITTASGIAAENQQVYCWGRNFYGQLGNDANGSLVDTANKASPVRASQPLQTTALATSISAGLNNTCAVAVVQAGGAKSAYCWGYNGYGNIGDATFADKDIPTLVSGALEWAAIAVRSYHTCGIVNADKSARCWGANWYGQLGDGTNNDSNIPVALSSAGGVVWNSLSLGYYHSCAFTSAGAANCWGANWDGQLGDGTTTASNTRKVVTGGLVFNQLGSGSSHNCGRVAGGAVYCWGGNWSGQLGGPGNGNSKTSPVQIIQ